ncbi:uncharacterized protein LOC125473559 [Pyrus x bretschneideri]|uniref:uncharacterized protein LOC125473559 n=1 Tax=Pyrus x bretschneideri TaxID=225117 RepID=UPI0020301F13|nr:uncharacterized protein LOC125473559 [Pyrus x bretschneideri]
MALGGQSSGTSNIKAHHNTESMTIQNPTQTCHLDLSAELFGGVSQACGRNLDRSRCCPVLAAWLFAAHARSALELPSSAPDPSAVPDQPMMPDDSQKCVNSLQSSLVSRNIRIPQPNASCDAVLCFCGIRLHQIGSLSCPAFPTRNRHHPSQFLNLEHLPAQQWVKSLRFAFQVRPSLLSRRLGSRPPPSLRREFCPFGSDGVSPVTISTTSHHLHARKAANPAPATGLAADCCDSPTFSAAPLQDLFVPSSASVAVV